MLNRIYLSGKIFKINKKERLTTFDLMFTYDSEKKQGKFIKVKAFKAAHADISEDDNKKIIELVGWLDKEEWTSKDGKKNSVAVIGTTEISLKKEMQKIEYKEKAIENVQSHDDDDIPF